MFLSVWQHLRKRNVRKSAWYYSPQACRVYETHTDTVFEDRGEIKFQKHQDLFFSAAQSRNNSSDAGTLGSNRHRHVFHQSA